MNVAQKIVAWTDAVSNARGDWPDRMRLASELAHDLGMAASCDEHAFYLRASQKPMARDIVAVPVTQ